MLAATVLASHLAVGAPLVAQNVAGYPTTANPPASTSTPAVPAVATRAGEPTYADLVQLAEAAGLVAKVRIRKQAEVPAARAAGVAPGMARLFVEADTLNLISGNAAVGSRLRYLVDVPRDARGRVPRLRKQEVIVFARAVPGRPGELQLVDPSAQLPATPDLEARIRPVLVSVLDPAKPPRVTGIADVLSIPGNLAGESETQLFLSTANGAPASLSVLRRPGQSPSWGVSWSEVVDPAATAPARDTLAWQRLACGLPAQLPTDANLASDPAAQAQAAADYALVLATLGPCNRNRASA
jgi:hypothetical protein